MGKLFDVASFFTHLTPNEQSASTEQYVIKVKSGIDLISFKTIMALNFMNESAQICPDFHLPQNVHYNCYTGSLENFSQKMVPHH